MLRHRSCPSALRRLHVGALFALLAVAPGCGDDPIAPSEDDVVGRYVATRFVALGNDVLAAGGSLELTFTEAGDTMGLLVVPEAVGGPAQADMAGSWTLDESTIVITQVADTFVRDATWTWVRGSIRGSFTAPDGEVRITLERVPS